mmetsp:Transcript_6682/g.13967  ORF Transcript_6682/g.13967 Transcript_6682/m.13967 type:complete len:236 (+) Transcript_6682:400-1107(+)
MERCCGRSITTGVGECHNPSLFLVIITLFIAMYDKCLMSRLLFLPFQFTSLFFLFLDQSILLQLGKKGSIHGDSFILVFFLLHWFLLFAFLLLTHESCFSCRFFFLLQKFLLQRTGFHLFDIGIIVRGILVTILFFFCFCFFRFRGFLHRCHFHGFLVFLVAKDNLLIAAHTRCIRQRKGSRGARTQLFQLGTTFLFLGRWHGEDFRLYYGVEVDNSRMMGSVRLFVVVQGTLRL